MIRTLKPEAFADEHFGAITVKDILAELEKPGRDPRPDFKVARFNDGVEDIKDLQPGMTLEGTVSNVAQFGAFVDLGVHQDGLVHVSQLAHKFVNDAREVVKTGDIVKVQGARGRPGAQAHLADDEARRAGRRHATAAPTTAPAGARGAARRRSRPPAGRARWPTPLRDCRPALTASAAGMPAHDPRRPARPGGCASAACGRPTCARCPRRPAAPRAWC